MACKRGHMTREYAIEILTIKRDGLATDIRQREMEGRPCEWKDKADSESVAALDMAIAALSVPVAGNSVTPPVVVPRNYPHSCPICGGRGEYFDGWSTAKVQCRACNGKGVVWG